MISGHPKSTVFEISKVKRENTSFESSHYLGLDSVLHFSVCGWVGVGGCGCGGVRRVSVCGGVCVCVRACMCLHVKENVYAFLKMH